MARYRVIPDQSRLWAEARSSLHPVRVETAGLEGTVEAEVAGGGAVVLLPGTRVTVAATLLKSGNGLIDGELRRRLDVQKHQQIIGEVKEVRPGAQPGSFVLRGELTFHGVTRSLEVAVTLRAVDERTIELAGEHTIDMRDYGLTPPKLLMFRVYPDVKVRAVVRALREA